MVTISFPCGCSITLSMFGSHQVMCVFHCDKHFYLLDENKSLKVMAQEIRNAQMIKEITNDD